MASGKQEPVGVHSCDHNTAGSDSNLLSGAGCAVAGVGGAVEELLVEDTVWDGGGVGVEGLALLPCLVVF